MILGLNFLYFPDIFALFSGALKDELGSYEVVTYVCTCSMLLGSVLLFLYPFVKKIQERRDKGVMAAGNDVSITVTA